MSTIKYRVQHPAIVILAAGESCRLGSPKQLLLYKGKSLLKHSADIALQTNILPVVIVMGANSDTIKKQLAKTKAVIARNERWQEGIASSIRCGLAAIQKINPSADGIIFMVCDQPHVSKSLLDSLVSVQHETGLPIVASSYENNLGTPALLHKSFFVELMQLKGDSGAKKLIKQHEKLVAPVAFPKGIIDIDTAADYEAILQ